MKDQSRIAIIANCGFIAATGLKALLQGQWRQADITIFETVSTYQKEQEHYSIVFSFLPIGGLNTHVVDPKSSAFTINQQLKEILDKVPQAKASTSKEEKKTSVKQLSARETDVLRLVATGLINKEIADQLNISLQTVLSHRKHISEKLGIRTTAGFTAYAMINGII